MMKYKLFLYLFFVTCAYSKQILKCEFAKALKINGVKMEHIPAFMCLASKLSEYRTDHVSQNRTSKHFGIFQLSNKNACEDKKSVRGGECNDYCEKFIDEYINNDIKCANYLREQHGFDYWKIYQDYCRPPKANGPPNRNIPNLKELNCRLDSSLPLIKPILQNRSNGGSMRSQSAGNIAKIEGELEFIPRSNTIDCVPQKSLLLPVKNPC